MNPRWGAKFLAVVAVTAGLGVSGERAAPERSGGVADCIFQRNPARFRDALRLHMEELSMRTEKVAQSLPAPSSIRIEARAAAASDEIAARKRHRRTGLRSS